MKTCSSGVLRLLMLGTAILLQSCGGSSDQSASDDTGDLNRGRSLQSTAQQKAEDSLVIFPASVPPGGTIAVMGGGFTDNCGVAIFLDAAGGVLLGNASVDQAGSYAGQFIVPSDTAEGEHDVVVEGRVAENGTCETPSDLSVTGRLTVTAIEPLITLSALEGRPGLTVDVDGRGFCPAPECSAVTILVDGQVGAEDIGVEGDGTFNTPAFVPPIDAAGPVAVTAIQIDAIGNELRAFAELVVTIKPNDRGPVIE